MAVKIRLSRRGRKKLAIYDVVIANSKSPRDGRFIEKIGTYNPNTNPASIVLNENKALDWVMKGAVPTDTVRAILSYRGIMMKKHLQVGVNKGAISQEQADAKYEEWKNSKEAKIQGKVSNLAKAQADAQKTKLDAETKVKEERAKALAAKKAEAEALNAPQAEQEAPQENVEETPSTQEEPTEQIVQEEQKTDSEPTAE